MQALLVILVLLNLGLLALNLWGPEDQPEPIPLTEASVASLKLVKDVAPAVYSSATGHSPSSCYTIGPYLSQRVADEILTKVRHYGLEVSLRSLRTLETLNYLVYIPPFANRAEAEAVVQDMQRFEVKDSLVIDAGPYENAISLGFFEDLNKAKRHAEYIRYLGYDARYTEQKAPREVQWLDYDEPFGSNTPVKLWSEALDPHSRLQVIPRACKTKQTSEVE
ncbi:MAG: SPOR domain-containing protein [Thiothrix sp.]|nr:MAG: SPOR domain-containing protein [Thiothrix sp.]